MTRWLEPEIVAVPPALLETVGGHPLVAQTLLRRGINTPGAARAFLDPASYSPSDPADLPDLSIAVERLFRAVDQGQRIAIWGDFDADGQTSTAVLLEALRSLGADVIFHIPARQQGHGLHRDSLEELAAKGTHLILTCDTGVTAHDAVVHANGLGMEVIITDHHVIDEYLPPALAVVNPHRLPLGHPMATLPGVGVAYEVAWALDSHQADQSLDLVALGTVADVATLTGDTRYLVQRGLDGLRRTCRPGLLAIYQTARLKPEGITEEQIGFLLGPRLNALGRLADAAEGVELLTTSDPTRARILASKVEGLNARRQWLTKQVTDAALGQIEREPALLNDYRALVLSHVTWPAGVIGIVAGRLAERFGKPAVLIAAPAGKLARASGRSVPGTDLIASLSDCAPLLESYGGHPGAAGFSIHPERIAQFRDALSRAVATRTVDIPESKLAIDAFVELGDLNLDLVGEINRLAPFGPGNPPLTLAIRDLRVLGEATIGRTGEHRRVVVEDALDRTQTVFWWQGVGQGLPQGRFDLAVTARPSDYRGVADIQVEWLQARELEPVVVSVEAAPAIEIRDHRTAADPLSLLKQLAEEESVQIWAEGDSLAGVRSVGRDRLAPGPRLVVWTLPPGPEELRRALTQVQPKEIFLFAHDPGLDEAGAFLQRLGGIVNFALKEREGSIDLELAAARLAHRISSVRLGLEWMEAQGQIHIAIKADDHWQLERQPLQRDVQRLERLRAQLDGLLAETAAFRAYVRDPETNPIQGWRVPGPD